MGYRIVSKKICSSTENIRSNNVLTDIGYIILALLKQAKRSLLISTRAEHYFIASSECGPYFACAYQTSPDPGQGQRQRQHDATIFSVTRNLTYDKVHVTRRTAYDEKKTSPLLD